MLLVVVLMTMLLRPATATPNEFERATNPPGGGVPPALRRSSSPPPFPVQRPRWRHHVFLNFRGPDVRRAFADHLYHALLRKGINAFRDDRDLPRGENITEAIPRAIEESRFSILVLSRGYASSAWCLDELVKILTCAKEMGHQPLPIFYNLSPDQISAPSSPSGYYKHDFDRHKKEYSYERVHSWLHALASIVDISGWILTESTYEAELVEDIASSMLRKVQELHWSSSSSITSVFGQSIRQSLHIHNGEMNATPDRVNHDSPAAEYEHLQFFKPKISPQGEKTVRIPKTVAQEGIKKYSQLALLGQRLSSLDSGSVVGHLNISILMKEANRLWNNGQSSKIIGVQEVGGAGVYIFTFPDRETRDTVVESSPCCIAKCSFAMRKWEPSMQLLLHHTVPVWVRLVGVPVEYMTPRGLSYVASSLGKPLYVDRATASGTHQLAFAKVCVEMMMRPGDGYHRDQGFTTSSISVAIGDDGGDGEAVVVAVRVLYQWSMPCSNSMTTTTTTAATQQIAPAPSQMQKAQQIAPAALSRLQKAQKFVLPSSFREILMSVVIGPRAQPAAQS
ncbi:unnamed protein product [Linum trigynum]|uniref:ADP-ribosyl cyclase/cyclic ADP-ribose hydrolase n=1 Tax=Linum trigynum TaxID=586398 RepID=A0AAV2CSD5_9ROSI